MPRYEPIEIGVPLECVRSDLVAFRWRDRGVTADFVLPHDGEHVLRVDFDQPCIIRILDEMPLSCEDDGGPATGLVSNHFAYRVDGSDFAKAQSEAWRTMFGPVIHHRFVTGSACLDVLSAASPTFAVINHKGS